MSSPRPTSPSLTSSPRLTEASYIVLGLLEQAKSATAYELKQLAQMSTINFWSVPHTQLYTECPRLAGAGLLSERQEETGRRRRVYQLTDAGREALHQWRRGDARRAHRHPTRLATGSRMRHWP
jgi:DNA-binding PadR family transcriptional regulator